MKDRKRTKEEPIGTVLEVDRTESLLESMLARAVAQTDGNRFAGVVIGELVGSTDVNQPPRVLYPGHTNDAPVVARSAIDIPSTRSRSQVVLVFEEGDPAKPIIIGILRKDHRSVDDEQSSTVDVEVDGERLSITAREQIVLRCGLASITLTRAGKVLIRGQYVSSRSAGVNRIKGGTVQIN